VPTQFSRKVYNKRVDEIKLTTAQPFLRSVR